MTLIPDRRTVCRRILATVHECEMVRSFGHQECGDESTDILTPTKTGLQVKSPAREHRYGVTIMRLPLTLLVAALLVSPLFEALSDVGHRRTV